MASAVASEIGWGILNTVMKRDVSDADSDEPEVAKKEIFTSWGLFILITLLIIALFVSYILQTRRIEAVHETVISIFSGMFVGLILRLTTTATSLLDVFTFDYQFFFNLLLPPIILAAGYELHQGNFFRYIGTILTFAFVGTFISAIVIGVTLYVWALLPLDSLSLSFVDAMSVGATLSATDPVTILAIFNTYKVDPHLYTVIFGESILNDAVAIVIFETAQRYKPKLPSEEDAPQTKPPGTLTAVKLVESFGVFMLIFFGSLVIGLAVGIGTSLLLKFTHVRRFPKIESCIILLIAYASYFFANAVGMSGIVSLLFCGICLKHYAYYNMSRRTQLTTKFIFQVLSQLSENFIFIYLGLSLFTGTFIDYQPLFIIVAFVSICIARGLAVFPLAKVINWFIAYEATKRGTEAGEMLSFPHQVMIFWAGLRGAVGVALAAALTGSNAFPLRTTVLVVVVLTVIIFGGTTARMLEILGIRTGVVDEIDSDDEFDIEIVPHGGQYRGRNGLSFGNSVKSAGNGIPLNSSSRNGPAASRRQYSTGNIHGASPDGSDAALSRKGSGRSYAEETTYNQQQGLLSPSDSVDDDETGLDLPPAPRRSQAQSHSPRTAGLPERTTSAPPPTTSQASSSQQQSQQNPYQSGGIRQFLSMTTEDPGRWFRQLDEDYIKPTLLLDSSDGNNHGHHGRGPGNV